MPARTKTPAAKEVAAAAAASSSESEAGVGTVLSSDEDSSEDGSEADDQSETSSDSADDSTDQDSDSLDSSAPRKRRRISPHAPSEDGQQDDDEIPKPSATFVSAPSRIMKREAVTGLPPVPVPAPAPAPAAVFGGATTAPTDPNTSFEALGVHPWLVQSLTNMAIRRPTGIQKGCIPEILKGRDCIGGSRTGSGKTVAFAVPILQKWAEDPSAIFAVVLTPTRYVWPHLSAPWQDDDHDHD